MKKSRSATRDWNAMDYDLLIRIFMALTVVDLPAVLLVCKSWRQACSDPQVWNKKLDLSRLSSKPFNIPMMLDAWYDEESTARMTQILKYALSLSKGKISCLIFNFYVYIKDVHFISAAERTPNLKRLVLPGSGHLSKTAVYRAMRSWGGLESMTITSKLNHSYIFAAIGKYCKNLSELKITFGFEAEHAAALIKHTPNLKVLSLRCILVNKKALSSVLNSLEHLEVVNICHSVIMDKPDRRSSVVVYPIHELPKHLNASCLRKLIICRRSTCSRCNNRSKNGPRRQQCDFLEKLWREDEIGSLAH